MKTWAKVFIVVGFGAAAYIVIMTYDPGVLAGVTGYVKGVYDKVVAYATANPLIAGLASTLGFTGITAMLEKAWNSAFSKGQTAAAATVQPAVSTLQGQLQGAASQVQQLATENTGLKGQISQLQGQLSQISDLQNQLAKALQDKQSLMNQVQTLQALVSQPNIKYTTKGG